MSLADGTALAYISKVNNASTDGLMWPKLVESNHLVMNLMGRKEILNR